MKESMIEIFSCRELLQTVTQAEMAWAETGSIVSSATGGLNAFAAGETVVGSGTSDNNGTFTVSSVTSANALVVAEALTDEAAGAGTLTQQVTSQFFDTSRFESLKGTINASQDCTVYIEQSQDNSTVVHTTEIAVQAGITAIIDVPVYAPKCRVRILNGATSQTTFKLYVNGVQ